MAIVYIDPDVAGPGTGTVGDPFKSWASVTWTAGNEYRQKCGTTFVGMVTIAADNVTVGSYSTGAKPIIDANSANNHAVYGINRSDVVVDGIDARNGTNTFGNIYFSTATNVSVKNCSVPSGANAGISLYQPTNCTVEGNTVSVTKQGILLANTGATRSGNVVRLNTVTGDSLFAGDNHGIEVQVYEAATKIGVLIEFNVCMANKTGIRTFGLTSESRIRFNDCSENSTGILCNSFDKTNQISGVRVHNNICNQNREFGIHVTIAGQIVVEHNTCNENGFNGGNFWGRGIELSGSTDPERVVGVIVRYNTCNKNKNYIANDTEGVGIGLDDASRECVVYGNICKDNEGNGLQLYGSNNLGGAHVVYSNLLINNATNSGGNFVANLHAGDETDEAQVFNNTCVGGIDGICVRDGSAGVVLKNNIISGYTGIGIKILDGISVTEAYNIVYGSGAAMSGQVLDATSSTVDPQLSSAYRPESGSPALWSGQHVGYYRDALKVQRPNPPSIGAYDVPKLTTWVGYEFLLEDDSGGLVLEDDSKLLLE